VEKVRDIVGLYLNPPENAVVLCVDEKSQIQALERTQPLLPMAEPSGNLVSPHQSASHPAGRLSERPRVNPENRPVCSVQ
jgi:hypothetical protein